MRKLLIEFFTDLKMFNRPYLDKLNTKKLTFYLSKYGLERDFIIYKYIRM